VEVPAELQYTLLSKVLAFDRSLAARVGDELVMGVVYQSGYPLSRDFARALTVVWRDTAVRAIEGIPIRFIEIDLTDPRELPAILRKHSIDLVVVAPLRAVSIREVLAQVRVAGATTYAAAASYVDDGAAVGVGMRAGRPRIRINLAAAKREGSDYDASLLRLAEVVR
jgi:hypothetical protein